MCNFLVRELFCCKQLLFATLVLPRCRRRRLETTRGAECQLFAGWNSSGEGALAPRVQVCAQL